MVGKKWRKAAAVGIAGVLAEEFWRDVEIHPARAATEK